MAVKDLLKKNKNKKRENEIDEGLTKLTDVTLTCCRGAQLRSHTHIHISLFNTHTYNLFNECDL